MIIITKKVCVRTLFKFMVIVVVLDGKYSFCLEGEVEFGGELKYIDITADAFTKMVLKMMCTIKSTCAMNTKT